MATVYTLKDGVKLYAFNTKSEAKEFCEKESDGLLRSEYNMRMSTGLVVGVPAEVRDHKGNSTTVFDKVIKFANEYRVVAYVAWLGD